MSQFSSTKQKFKTLSRRILKREDESKLAVLARSSDLFDREYYLRAYADVQDSDLDPITHYVRYGASEHRLPGPWANTDLITALHEQNENWLVDALERGTDPENLIAENADFIFHKNTDHLRSVCKENGIESETVIEQLRDDVAYIQQHDLIDLDHYQRQSPGIEKTSFSAAVDYCVSGRKNGFSLCKWIPSSAISAKTPVRSGVESYLSTLQPGFSPDDVLALVKLVQSVYTLQNPSELIGILKEREALIASDLLEVESYRAAAQIEGSDIDPALHYILVGEAANCMPNSWFVPEKSYIEDQETAHSGQSQIHLTQLLRYKQDWENVAVALAAEAKDFQKGRLDGAVECLAKSMPSSRTALEKLTRDYVALSLRGSFDPAYYQQNYGEYLAGFEKFPMAHYVAYGAASGANPNATFNATAHGAMPKNLETEPNPYLIHLQKEEARDAFLQSVFGDEMDREDYYFLELLDERFPNLDKVQYENLVADYELLKFSDTLDEDLYNRLNTDVKATGLSPLIHFVLYGAEEGRWPAEWYNIGEGYESNPDFKRLRKNPFADYIRNNPNITRNVKTQAIKYRGDIEALKAELEGSGLFDDEYYKKSLNVTDAKFDAVEHYLKFGRIYKMAPRSDFDPEWYWGTYSDCQEMQLDPFVHYVRIGHEEGRKTQSTSTSLASNESGEGWGGRVNAPMPGAKTEFFEEKRMTSGPAALRCFTWYLPQFHPCAENNEFWGDGFTEWTNVTTALPKFSGHVQPKLPSDFGFYDLRLPEVMKQQAALAKAFHIEGFAFYYYWFGGKRVLDLPIENFLKTPDIDIDFFLCWANENWTRRWDGKDQDVLLAQNHSAEDDRNLLEDWKRHIDDPRYTRIDGKPLIAIYRPDLIPDMKKTMKRWRAHAKKIGIGDLYFCAVNSFGYKTAKVDGFNAWIEFPPHSFTALKNVTMEKDIPENFGGAIYDYDSYVAENYDKEAADDLPTFRGAMPSWDNTARKKNNATIFDGATPQKFQSIVSRQIEKLKDANKDSEQVLIVNAWNEWAEGTYMEPDRALGHANINALGRALTHVKQKCVLISNSAKTADVEGFMPDYPIEILPALLDNDGQVQDLEQQLCHYGEDLLAYDVVLFDPDKSGLFTDLPEKRISKIAESLEALSSDIKTGYGYLSVDLEKTLNKTAAKPPKVADHITMEFLSLMGVEDSPKAADFGAVDQMIYFKASSLRPILENAQGLRENWLTEPDRHLTFSSLLLYCINNWGYEQKNFELT